MAQRADLLSEVDTTLDGSGVYTGPWIDSAGVDKTRVAYRSSSSVGELFIEQSSDQSNILYHGADSPLSSSVGGILGDHPLAARYFRVRADNGTANAVLRFSVRAIA